MNPDLNPTKKIGRSLNGTPLPMQKRQLQTRKHESFYMIDAVKLLSWCMSVKSLVRCMSVMRY
jgi:hypothetical protein